MRTRAEDAALMQRIEAGDIAAFEALYDGYRDLVYTVAVRITRTPQAAEDVAQAVFVKIWCSPGAYRPGFSPFAAWIARVARNCAVDMIRRSKPLTQLRDDFVAQDPLDVAVLARIDAQQVREALATLSDLQRAAITLAFFNGLSHRQIAERTATPVGTVKSRIRTGLQKLRSRFEMSAVS